MGPPVRSEMNRPDKRVDVRCAESPSEIRKIRWGSNRDNRLNLRIQTVRRICAVRVPGSIENAEHRRQVPPRRMAHGPNAIGIDAEISRSISHEAHGPLDILHGGWIAKGRRRPMRQHERGEACCNDWLHEPTTSWLSILKRLSTVPEWRLPAGPRDHDYADSVRRLRVAHIHEECETGVHPINDVLLDAPLTGSGADAMRQVKHRTEYDFVYVFHLPLLAIL
jgi:hypothetical protein